MYNSSIIPFTNNHSIEKCRYISLVIDTESTEPNNKHYVTPGIIYEVGYKFTGYWRSKGKWHREKIAEVNRLVFETFQFATPRKHRLYTSNADQYTVTSFENVWEEMYFTLEHLMRLGCTTHIELSGFRIDNDFDFMYRTQDYIRKNFGTQNKYIHPQELQYTVPFKVPRGITLDLRDLYSVYNTLTKKHILFGHSNKLFKKSSFGKGVLTDFETLFKCFFMNLHYSQKHTAREDVIDEENLLFDFLKTTQRLPETAKFGKTPKHFFDDQVTKYNINISSDINSN